MKNISFIINGKLKKLNSLKFQLKKAFPKEFDLRFAISTLSTSLTDLTKQEIANNADYIIAVGGDGSLNEIVNGVMESGAKDDIVLGLLPFGSGNDFAKSVEITTKISQLVSLIKDNNVLPIDIGKIDHLQKDKKNKGTRFFINISDLGLGGEVVSKFRTKGLFGIKRSYATAIMGSFLFYKHKQIKFVSEHIKWSGKILSLCLANGKYFGNGLCVSPDSKVNDGKIQLVLIGNLGILAYLMNLTKLKRGEKIMLPEVSYHTIESCEIYSEENNELPIDMDGEFVGYTPLKMSVEKGAISFLTPLSLN